MVSVRSLCIMAMVFSTWGNIGLADQIRFKEPNVAGQFYSADPKELALHIDYLKQSAVNTPHKHKIPLIIAPHAGYPFSGLVAGYVYKAIAQQNIKTVVVIAPSHFLSFQGISIWAQGAFKTPLGVLDVDEDFAGALLKEDAAFKDEPRAFEREHALEVQLPFLQKTFSNIKIVPILMGDPDFKVCQSLADALDKLIGNRDDVLVVASSDMSHYYPYEEANHKDAQTMKAIADLDADAIFNGNLVHRMEMCGFLPVVTGLIFAQKRGLKPQVLKYANSGDTAGDKSRVVGYPAVIFYREGQLLYNTLKDKADHLTDGQKQQLIAIARGTVDSFVKTGKVPSFDIKDQKLLAVQGAFVTLHKEGQLRGCIGHIIGQMPLWQTVRDVAVAAAKDDPRFKPVTVEELSKIKVEVSVLSSPVRVHNADEIVLGRDGVILSDGAGHQGVFLPQVADETGWSKEEFLSELASQKAGLARDAWKDPNIQLYTFTATVFEE